MADVTSFRFTRDTGIQVPKVRPSFVDLGNVITTAETVKNLQSERNLINLQTEKASMELEEFKKSAPSRKRLAELSFSERQLDLLSRTSEAMKNELVSITVDQYPAFIKKWRDAGIDVSQLPHPVDVNTPQKFRAYQRQAVMDADALQQEIEQENARIQERAIERIKQEGHTKRESLKTEGEKERARIKEEAATKRSKIKKDSELKPTGDLATFQIIHGRKPKNASEFKKFKQAIKITEGLTDEQKEIKRAYFQAIGRANDAKRGTGQFVPDPNKEDVANQEYQRAQELRDAYVEAGGNLKHLGETENPKVPKNAPRIKQGDIIRNKKTGQRRKWSGSQWLDWDGENWVIPKK